MAIALKKLLGLHRPPRTRSIVGESTSGEGMPNVDDWLNDAPARLHHVSALKQSGVAGHAIAKQAFVTCAMLGAKVALVVEVHINESKAHDRAWHFCSEAERDSFIRLNVNHQAIGLEILHGGIAKQN